MFNRIKTPLMLAGVSAGIMYLFDPDLGKRRRSLLRDKLIHFRNKIAQSCRYFRQGYGASTLWNVL